MSAEYDYFDAYTYDGITEREAYESYDEWLDSLYESFDMGEVSYYPSDILKNCDPIAYRVGFNDYASFMIEDGLWAESLEELEDDDTED